MFDDVRLILDRASDEAARSGVSAMDSLHPAAAYLLKADEFLTTENRENRSTDPSLSRSAGCMNESYV